MTISPNPPALCKTIKQGPVLRPSDLEWDEIGPVDDPPLKLKTNWQIGSAMFHVEAFRVRRGEDGFQSIDSDVPEDEDVSRMIRDLEELGATFMPENGFSTIKLDDADYVLFIFPHSA